MKPIPCAVCGKLFAPRKHTTRCCSRVCGWAYQAQRARRLQLKPCPGCDAVFQPARTSQRYCVSHCRRQHNSSRHACVPIFSEVDADLRMLRWRSEGGYPRTWWAGRNTSAHRLVLARVAGRALAKGEIADHLNHNPLDARRENLRLTDLSGNRRNLARTSAVSGFIGVRSNRQNWRAQIGLDGRLFHLGCFPTPVEAAAAYDAKAEEFGFLTRNSRLMTEARL